MNFCTNLTVENWIAIVQTALTFIVAIFASIIASRQVKSQKDANKIALFERRYKVYESIKFTLGMIIRDGYVSDADVVLFYTAARQAKFLFDDELRRYIEQIDNSIVKLGWYVSVGKIGGTLTQENHSENSTNFAWLVAQPKILDEKFVNFMSMHKI